MYGKGLQTGAIENFSFIQTQYMLTYLQVYIGCKFKIFLGGCQKRRGQEGGCHPHINYDLILTRKEKYMKKINFEKIEYISNPELYLNCNKLLNKSFPSRILLAIPKKNTDFLLKHIKSYPMLNYKLSLPPFKDPLSGLRLFPAIKIPFKTMKNVFYFTSRAFFILKILKATVCKNQADLV